MNPKIYLVGGAVRDVQLNGYRPKDRDYVVVGANVKWMEENGYVCVSKNGFPVFHGPDPYDKTMVSEFALARREKKIGHGYNGFDIETCEDVSLTEDLYRRDLTVNAIAQDIDTGELFDPFGGLNDLKNGVLRHVSEHFSEDPLRVLRVLRFSAKYNFGIHPETIKMCNDIIHEIDHLPWERIWNEIRLSCQYQYNSLFLRNLRRLEYNRSEKLNKIVSRSFIRFTDITEPMQVPVHTIVPCMFNVNKDFGSSNDEIRVRNMMGSYFYATHNDGIMYTDMIMKFRMLQQPTMVEELEDAIGNWFEMIGACQANPISKFKNVYDAIQKTDISDITSRDMKGKLIGEMIKTRYYQVEANIRRGWSKF